MPNAFSYMNTFIPRKGHTDRVMPTNMADSFGGNRRRVVGYREGIGENSVLHPPAAALPYRSPLPTTLARSTRTSISPTFLCVCVCVCVSACACVCVAFAAALLNTYVGNKLLNINTPR